MSVICCLLASSSSVWVFNAAGGWAGLPPSAWVVNVPAAGRSGGRHTTAGQYSYVPLGLHLDWTRQQCIADFAPGFCSFALFAYAYIIYWYIWPISTSPLVGVHVLRLACLSVRLSVCLSGRLSEKRQTNFHLFFCTPICYRWQWLHLLVAMQYVLYASGVVDDVR